MLHYVIYSQIPKKQSSYRFMKMCPVMTKVKSQKAFQPQL